MKHDVASAAVMTASGLVAVISSVPNALVSLAIGLIGVALARWIFVNREVRRTNLPQSWRETVPLTLMAMLVAGVIIWDRKLSMSSSAFLGLGVGWVAVLLLDIFGERVLAMFKTNLSSGPADPKFPTQADISGHDGMIIPADTDLPQDFRDKLAQIDSEDLAHVKDQPKDRL